MVDFRYLVESRRSNLDRSTGRFIMSRREVRAALLGMGLVAGVILAVGFGGMLLSAGTPSEKSLRKQLVEIDRVRVRSGGTCHRDPDAEQTLAEERNSDQIRRLIDSIRIVPNQGGLTCMCCGNPSLEFYRGEELVVTLGYHHGKNLRWRDHWNGDAVLTQESRDWINAWLKERGVQAENIPTVGQSLPPN